MLPSQILATSSSPKSSPKLRRQAVHSDFQADRPLTFQTDCFNSTSFDRESCQGYSSADEASNTSTLTGNETGQSIMDTSLGQKQTIPEPKKSHSTKPTSCQSKERKKVYIRMHCLKKYNSTPALVCTY